MGAKQAPAFDCMIPAAVQALQKSVFYSWDLQLYAFIDLDIPKAIGITASRDQISNKVLNSPRKNETRQMQTACKQAVPHSSAELSI